MPNLFIQIILSHLLHPGYIGSFCWLIVGSLIIYSVDAPLKRAAAFDGQLRETVCIIKQGKPNDCMHVDYIADQSKHTSQAKFPPINDCLRMKDYVDIYNVNHQYYCWYEAENPANINMRKYNRGLNHQAYYIGSIIVLISLLRIVYLFATRDKSSPIVQDTNNSVTEMNFRILDFSMIYNFIFSTAALIILFIFFLFTINFLGIFYNYFQQRHYVNTICQILDKKVNPNYKVSERPDLYISYPVKQLTYTAWILLPPYMTHADLEMNTIACMFDGENPSDVILGTRLQIFKYDLFNDLTSLIAASPLLLLMFIFSRLFHRFKNAR